MSKNKLTVLEIEALLERDEEIELRILPNGEIVSIGDTDVDLKDLKPITMRENLGGEYAFCA